MCVISRANIFVFISKAILGLYKTLVKLCILKRSDLLYFHVQQERKKRKKRVRKIKI